MYRLYNVWLWLCIIAYLLKRQSIIRNTTTDAYGIPTTANASLRRPRRSFLSAKIVKNPLLSDDNAITSSLSSSTSGPRSRQKRKTKSETRQQDSEKSTPNGTTILIPDAESISPPKAKRQKAKKADDISQKTKDIHNCRNNSNGTKLFETTIAPPTHWIVDTDKVIYQEISIPVVEATDASSTTTRKTNDDMSAIDINANETIP